MDINNIVYVVLGIVSVVVTGVVVPLIKKKTSQADIDNAIAMVEIAVKAAEQIYRQSGQGELKKKYVLNYLNDKGIKLSDEDINNLIESTVLEINRWKEELQAKPTVNIIKTEDYKKPRE